MSFCPPPQLLPSLPPELLLEIVSYLVQPHSGAKYSSGTPASFSSRIRILTTLSLTAPSLRTLLLSSPLFWSEVEISVIKDVACSPPLSFVQELFKRSAGVEMSVRVIHWGEERDYNQERGWEWTPGVTREIRRILDENENRTRKLCFEFHHLNGTEYSSRGKSELGSWRALKELEVYAHDWATVRSLQMGWVEFVIANASPETVIIRGSGAFGWAKLGRDMTCIRVLRVETEIPESLAFEIISKTPGLEECYFKRIIQVSRGEEVRGVGSGGVKLGALRRLYVGSLRGAGQFLNRIEPPKTCALEFEVGGRGSTLLARV